MPQPDPPLLRRAKREIAEVEKALREGYAPWLPPGRNLEKSAIRVAAERLETDRLRLRSRIGSPDQKGLYWRRYKLAVDWSLYKPRHEQAPKQADGPPPDPINVRRLRDENLGLRRALEAAERRAAIAENIREGVLALHDLPPPPIAFPAPPKSKGNAETVVLVLSDLHWGEKVDLEALDG